MACLIFWFANLSSATNMSALLLPDAGGDLISRYCSPRFCQTRSCIGRMPIAFDLVELPSWAYFTETEGIEIGSLMRYAPSCGCSTNRARSVRSICQQVMYLIPKATQ